MKTREDITALLDAMDGLPAGKRPAILHDVTDRLWPLPEEAMNVLLYVSYADSFSRYVDGLYEDHEDDEISTQARLLKPMCRQAARWFNLDLRQEYLSRSATTREKLCRAAFWHLRLQMASGPSWRRASSWDMDFSEESVAKWCAEWFGPVSLPDMKLEAEVNGETAFAALLGKWGKD